MKDTARSRKTYYNLVREGLIENHPKIFNLLLILALISLTGLAAFLVSDILSFGLNASHKGPSSSGFDLQRTRASVLAMMNWQEKGMKPIAPGNFSEPIKVLDNVTGANSSEGDKWDFRPAVNRSDEAKGTLARAGAENLSHPDLAGLSNSSRNEAAGSAAAGSTAWGSGSETYINRGHSSSKDSNQHHHADASPSKTASQNNSQLNMQINSSNNIIESLPAAGPGSNEIKNSYHLLSPNNTTTSSDNSSADQAASAHAQMNSTNSNSTEIDGSLSTAKDASVASTAPELYLIKNATTNQDEAADPETKDNAAQEDKPQVEPPLSTPDQNNNVASSAEKDRSDTSLADNAPVKILKFDSGQGDKSIGGSPNPAETSKGTVSARDNSAKSHDSNRGQINKRNTIVRSPSKPAPPSRPQVNKKTKGDPNPAEGSSKTVSASKASAKSQDAEHDKTTKGNKIVRSPNKPAPPTGVRAPSPKHPAN